MAWATGSGSPPTSCRRSVADPRTPLPSPTVFSVEPGIYLEGETGVRIEDLVVLDAEAGRLELLTRFPRGVIVVGSEPERRRAAAEQPSATIPSQPRPSDRRASLRPAAIPGAPTR